MSIEQLTYKIKDKLFRFAYRIVGDSADAQDVVQDVFVKVWDKRSDLADIQNPEAWCMTLTKNAALDKLRSKHRRTTDLEAVGAVADAQPTPHLQAETGDMVAKIKLLMHQLPEKQRLAMHLRDIEGLSYEEISETLQMPLPQVKVNIHRARQTLRAALMNY